MDMTSENMRVLRTGWKATFQVALASFTSLVMPFAAEVDSDADEEIYSWLGQLPALKKWIGPRVIEALVEHDYRIKNEPFQMTVEVPRKKIARDTHNNYAIAIKGMGTSAAKWPEQLLVKAIVAAFDTVCYDGQNFIDEDHPIVVNGKKTTFSNLQDGTEEPWILLDMNQAIEPFIFQKTKEPEFITKDDPETSDHVFKTNNNLYAVDTEGAVGYSLPQIIFGSKAELNTANYNLAVDAMAALVNENGDPLNVTPTHILIGIKNRSKAAAMFTVKTQTGGGDNVDYNAVEIVKITALKKAA